MALTLAIDIGASKVRLALFQDGRIKAKSWKPNPGSEEGIREAVANLMESLGLSSGFSGRVGVASIGPLDLSRGYIIASPNISGRVVRLSKILKELMPDSRVAILNDALASAWGEYLMGRHRGIKDLGFVTLSTGVGGGFVVGGELVVGSRGNAHEVGHIVVDTGWEARCGCGGLGHWEAIASGRWIPRTAKILASTWRGGRTGLIEDLEAGLPDAGRVFERAREGDEFALLVVDYIARVTAAGLASVKAAYDPDVVLVGGPVFLKNMDLLAHPMKRYLQAYAPFGLEPRIEPASFGEDEGLYGAYAVAVRRPRGVPEF
ncbi:MAG: ROK family protein [Aeropyrum sp.]|nr:ROK family protein [Aeropyrum sp.]MCE4616398.1 ROK family protein [Aeropyrum sp.]